MGRFQWPASEVFVGRAHALAELDAALDAARGGRGSLVLVTGDPGIGKTRLVAEMAGHARTRGMLVLWGTCWEGGGVPAYWPWAQVLRAWMRDAGAASLDMMGPGAVDLAPLLPEAVGDRFLAKAADGDERVRLRLFDALAETLLREAKRRPIVVVLDDLHWADVSSLLALRFLAAELRRGRLLVVGMYRDSEVDAGHPLAAALADLDRMGQRVALPGLDDVEVARFIAVAAGAAPEPAVVAAVLRRTGGNPLFVRELVRLAWLQDSVATLLTDPSDPGAVPAAVGEVIARQLDMLPPRTREVLTVAAVEGEEFALGTVARVTGRAHHEVLAALDHAVAARLVSPLAATPGRFRFAHALIRDVVYQALSAERRAALHGRTGEVLEKLHGDAREHLAAIAAPTMRAPPRWVRPGAPCVR